MYITKNIIAISINHLIKIIDFKNRSIFMLEN